MAGKAISYVRFSSSEQSKGDSQHRQLELANSYAKEHGLELDDSLKFQDLGLSAYSGDHKTKGQLGQLLKLIDDGQIRKGDVLIVESMDRLSREEVLFALGPFTDMIKAGIKVVTTLGGFQEYDEDSINKNPYQLFQILIEMARANEESAKKSKRLKAAWVGKRNNAHKKKLTARAPLWLELSEDRSKFIPIKERCKIINRIFNLKFAGKGGAKIAWELNQRKGIHWMPKNGWRKSYIDKILRNKAVIGEYQPHEKKNGKMVPVGDPIPNYYPAVVNEKIFYRVQHLIGQNRHFGGRNGRISNLFGGIAKCADCGAPMRLIDKGKPPRGAKYYVCDKAKRGLGCEKKYIRYNEFEEVVLHFCMGLRLEDILDVKKHETELNLLKDELTVINHNISNLESQLKNLTDEIAEMADTAARKILRNSLEERVEDKEKCEKDRGKLEKEISKLTQAGTAIAEDLRSAAKVIDYMGQKSGEELADIRLSLRNQIRRLIKRIDVCTYSRVVGVYFWEGDYQELVMTNTGPDVISYFNKKTGYTSTFCMSKEEEQESMRETEKFLEEDVWSKEDP